MPELNVESIQARTWLMLALDACDRAGLTPIAKFRFHRLIFLSNCLAELFKATPPSKRVIKYKRGPFYPDVQWQLDRLVTMGLASISNLVIEADEHGPWMEADYNINDSGIEMVREVKLTALGEATSRYIDEVVFAFARVQDNFQNNIALSELNYSEPGIAEGALITFEDAKNNQAMGKVDEFERIAPTLLAQRTREKVQLYLRYLEVNAI
jgi:hypothetical protein